jgi:hypothetical protein
LQVVRELRRKADNIAEEILRVTLEGFEFGVFVTRVIRFGFHRCAEERAEAQEFNDANALQAFQEDDDVAIGHFDGLVDFGESADFVEVRRSRIFDPRIELGNYTQKFLVAHERVNEGERAFAAHSERQDSAREENGVPNG